MKLKLFLEQQFLGALDLGAGGKYAGRDVSNTIVLASHPGVSRRHAYFFERNGAVFVKDLQTAQGTWINDKRIKKPTRLKNGDRVRLGGTELEIQLATGTAKPNHHVPKPVGSPAKPAAAAYLPHAKRTAPARQPLKTTPLSAMAKVDKEPFFRRQPYMTAAIGIVIAGALVAGIYYGTTAAWYRRGERAAMNSPHPDWQQAVHWYAKAAARGHSDSQYKLGICYEEGRGLTRDIQAAVKWIRRAAAKRHNGAIFRLGHYHEIGAAMPADENRAFQYYRQAAERGHPEAQYVLAHCYVRGYGTTQDDRQFKRWIWSAATAGHTAARHEHGMQCLREGRTEMAVSFLRLAAASNYAPAVYQLSRCYFQGEGVVSNAAEAVNYLRRAADSSHVDAQYDLGMLYLEGLHLPVSFEHSAGWLRRAAEQDHPRAQYEFGMLCLAGKGTVENPTEAVAWLKQAAEAGIPPAQYQYARCLAKGLGITSDADESAIWLRRAYAGGQTAALENLLEYFFEKYPIAPDNPDDMAFIVNAAESGNIQAQYRAALAMLQGVGGPRDPYAAAGWLHAAAEKEHPEALYQLGLCYLEGIGVTTDRAMAAQWFSRAAEQGHAEARFRYGRLLETGQGVPRDTSQALQMYLPAAEQGHPQAFTNLVNTLVELPRDTRPLSNSETAQWLTRGAESGMPNAMYELAQLYNLGRGVQPDRQMALFWNLSALKNGYRQALPAVLETWLDNVDLPPDKPLEFTPELLDDAAFDSSVDTQFHLAQCHALGRGLPADEQQAFKWHKHAAERGHTEAMHHLAESYRNGTGTETNQTEAVRWHENAADAGHIESQYQLGIWLIEQPGESKKADAISWLLKAAQSGNMNAQYAVGLCCLRGIGTGRDHAAARRWLGKAAAQGHAQAAATLRIMPPPEQKGETGSTHN